MCVNTSWKLLPKHTQDESGALGIMHEVKSGQPKECPLNIVKTNLEESIHFADVLNSTKYLLDICSDIAITLPDSSERSKLLILLDAIEGYHIGFGGDLKTTLELAYKRSVEIIEKQDT